MDYATARRYIPAATHYYAGVTTEELDQVESNKSVTYINGETLMGTDVPCEALVDKEILRPEDYVDVVDTLPLPVVDLTEKKQTRETAVATIKVTTTAGNTYDGDEISQTRMARAIVVMSETDTIGWVLSDNTVVVIDKAELSEALKRAGAEMARLWVQVYE